MKIFFILVLFFFSISNGAFASDTLYFAGKIKVSKSLSYKYYLRFTINIKNQLTGYSLSDPGGLNETKTRITGTYDSLNKIIKFEESNILRSRVDLKKNDLCFVSASLILKNTKLVETLSGKFKGFGADRTTQCANGEIQLINTDRAKAILEKIANKEDNPEVIHSDKNTKNKLIKIDDEKGKEFEITGNSIKLTIWDNGQVDGDRISIMLNGKYLLENYSTVAAPKMIETLLSGNISDTIKIIALNEGTLPPNTAAIIIETPFEKYKILTQANTNEVRSIYLRKKPGK